MGHKNEKKFLKMIVFFEKVHITWNLEIHVHWTRRTQDPITLKFLKMYETLGNDQICLETSIKVISAQWEAHFTCFWQLFIPQKNLFGTLYVFSINKFLISEHIQITLPWTFTIDPSPIVWVRKMRRIFKKWWIFWKSTDHLDFGDSCTLN